MVQTCSLPRYFTLHFVRIKYPRLLEQKGSESTSLTFKSQHQLCSDILDKNANYVHVFEKKLCPLGTIIVQKHQKYKACVLNRGLFRYFPSGLPPPPVEAVATATRVNVFTEVIFCGSVDTAHNSKISRTFQLADCLLKLLTLNEQFCQ